MLVLENTFNIETSLPSVIANCITTKSPVYGWSVSGYDANIDQIYNDADPRLHDSFDHRLVGLVWLEASNPKIFDCLPFLMAPSSDPHTSTHMYRMQA